MTGVRPRAVRQSIFTIVARADAARLKELQAFLHEIDAALMQQNALPFGAIDMLHFCSFTVFLDDRFGPYLVFENNIDGAPSDFIDTLCNVAAPALHTIYGFCPDYGAPGAVNPEYLRRYLQQHIVRADAPYVGNVGRTAQRIRDEAALVAYVADFLDGFDARGVEPDAIVAAARAHVRRDARWNWVWNVPPRLAFYDRALRWAALVGLAAVILAELPLALLGSFLFLAALRRREKTDPVHIPGPPPGQVVQLTSHEDQIVQNHMSSLCYVKPGAFRRRTLKSVLFLVRLIARVSTNGKLTGLDSLHFAHWTLIDDDTRLLFLTNYDGSWENYLDDFIDKTSYGLTAIWSNTLNFPSTQFLIFGGAKDERKFKAISRTTQADTNVWYSAYPSLPVTAIENNSAICDGLSKPPATFDAVAWLRRF